MAFSDDEFRRMQEHMEKFGAQTELLSKLFERSNKEASEFEKELKKLTAGIKDGSKSYADQLSALKDLDAALEKIEETTNDTNKTQKLAEKEALLSMRKKLQAEAAYQGTVEQSSQAIAKTGKSLVLGAGQFVRNLQDNASSSQIATGLFNAGVDATGAVFTGVGQIFQTTAPIVAMMGTKGKFAALGMEVLGTALEKATPVVSELVKYGFEILQKELDSTWKTFNQLASTGAMFANGMTGMRNAAFESGLTVEQFGKVVSENADFIAKSGIGYAGTMQKLSGVQKQFATGTNNTREQLLKLGYSFEDQAGLILETMSDMRRGGLLQHATNDQIAEQTKEYAENLRVISAITGEDAKKRMADARMAMQNTAIQSKLLEMQRTNPEAYKKLQAQLATMPAEMQKMYLQKIGLGSVVDPVSAALMAQVPALDQAMEANIAVLYDGSKDAKAATDEAGRQRGILAKGLEGNMKDLSILGQAQLANVTGIGSDMASMAGSMYDQLSGTTEDTAKAARTSVEEQKMATDKLTTSLVGAEEEAQKFKTALQDDLLGSITKYADVSKKTLTALESMLTKLGLMDKNISESKPAKPATTPGLEGPGATQRFLKKSTSPAAEVNPVSFLADLIAIPAEAAYKKGEQWGEQIGNSIKGWWSDNGNMVASEAKKANDLTNAFADGGIASGPISGFAATLHGTEAVVPLPNGRSIPVEINDEMTKSVKSMDEMIRSTTDGRSQIDTANMMATMQEQNNILQQMLSTLKSTHGLTSGILQNTY